MSLYDVAIKSVQKQFKEVVKEGEETMKSLAPQPPVPTPTSHRKLGKGSWVTGATRDSIHAELVSDHEAIVKPETKHAYYAEHGNSSMEGWHFAEKTAQILKGKYGG